MSNLKFKKKLLEVLLEKIIEHLVKVKWKFENERLSLVFSIEKKKPNQTKGFVVFIVAQGVCRFFFYPFYAITNLSVNHFYDN